MISKVLLQYEVYRYVVCLPRRVRQVMGLSVCSSLRNSSTTVL